MDKPSPFGGAGLLGALASGKESLQRRAAVDQGSPPGGSAPDGFLGELTSRILNRTNSNTDFDSALDANRVVSPEAAMDPFQAELFKRIHSRRNTDVGDLDPDGTLETAATGADQATFLRSRADGPMTEEEKAMARLSAHELQDASARLSMHSEAEDTEPQPRVIQPLKIPQLRKTHSKQGWSRPDELSGVSIADRVKQQSAAIKGAEADDKLEAAGRGAMFKPKRRRPEPVGLNLDDLHATLGFGDDFLEQPAAATITSNSTPQERWLAAKEEKSRTTLEQERQRNTLAEAAIVNGGGLRNDSHPGVMSVLTAAEAHNLTPAEAAKQAEKHRQVQSAERLLATKKEELERQEAAVAAREEALRQLMQEQQEQDDIRSSGFQPDTDMFPSGSLSTSPLSNPSSPTFSPPTSPFGSRPSSASPLPMQSLFNAGPLLSSRTEGPIMPFGTPSDDQFGGSLGSNRGKRYQSTPHCPRSPHLLLFSRVYLQKLRIRLRPRCKPCSILFSAILRTHHVGKVAMLRVLLAVHQLHPLSPPYLLALTGFLILQTCGPGVQTCASVLYWCLWCVQRQRTTRPV